MTEVKEKKTRRKTEDVIAEKIKDRESKINIHKIQIEKLTKEIDELKYKLEHPNERKGRGKSDSTKAKELVAQLVKEGKTFDDIQKLLNSK